MSKADRNVSASFGVLAYGDFEDLLAGAAGSPVDFEQLDELALARGRILLQAPAGAGKTSLLVGLARGVQRQLTVDYVDLSRLAAPERDWPTTDDAEDWLWTRLSEREGTRLLCIDSLDEVPAEQGQNLLDAIEAITNRTPSLAVIVADRLGRRRLRTDRWALLSLSRQEAATGSSPGTQDPPTWTQLPYFVDMSRSFGTARTPAEAISRVAAVLSPDDRTRVASAALEAWEILGQSVMEEGWLRQRVGADLFLRMEDNGLLHQDQPNRFSFAHSLLHGYFAALALSRDEASWDKHSFEALTHKGASFEALGMLLAMVNDPQVDRLVRRVDEWNFYAAAYLLAEDFDAGGRTSRRLSTALLLMLGRRKFSPVPSTRIQVEDSLRLHHSELAASVLQTTNVAELVELASRQPIEHAWWDSWISVFRRLPGEAASISEVRALEDDDGVLAWTAANVLVSCTLSDEVRAELGHLARVATDDSTRWRAVHVLGSAADSQTLQILVASFQSDPSAWVRNGSLRSAILVASKVEDADTRAGFFAQLAESTSELLANPKWLREVERSTQLDVTPADWPDAVGLLLESLWAHSDSVEQQDRWRRLSASLRTRWAGSSKLGTLQ